MDHINCTSRPQSLAQAISLIERDQSLSYDQRRSKLAALRLFGRISGAIALDAVPFTNAQAIMAAMEAASAKALDVSPGYLRTQRSVMRGVLRSFGLLAPARGNCTKELSTAWAALIAPLGRRYRLAAFCRFCAARGMEPDAVTSATLEAWLEDNIARLGPRNQRAGAAEVARLWNGRAGSVPGWPATRLSLTPIDRFKATPLDAYPAPLQAEIESFLQGMAPPPPGRLFRGPVGDGASGSVAPKPVSAATIEARRTGLRLLLHGATALGIAREQLTSLAQLIVPETAAAILEWHNERLGSPGPCAALGGLADTLTAVAAFRRLQGPERDRLRSLLAQARPQRQREMPEHLVQTQVQLEQPHIERLLLRLPQDLMAKARGLVARQAPQSGDADASRRSRAEADAAGLAAIAAAIEIELHLPLRALDLARLRVDDHVTFLGEGRRQRCRIAICAHKNSVPVLAQLSAGGTALLREYLEHWRPLGPHPQTDWLFPARDSASTHRSEGHFSEAITRHIERQTGVRMTLHRFRAFAAGLILRDHPHALGDVRAVLGHASLDTACRHYMHYDRLAASGRLSQTIEQRRDGGSRS